MAGGRPRKQFDEKKFQSLCAMWCTEKEICSFFQTTDKTLSKWCKRAFNMSFSDAYKKYSQDGNISLRRAQYKRAVEDGNVTMLIWLGKQYLGQTEKVEQSIKAEYQKDDALSASLRDIAKSLESDDK